ncbi:Fc.00g065320.m01.CDS01 [Cosmosporella sp. VM-42]
MATANDQPPSFRCESPSDDSTPTPALGACPELSRCLSTASSWSHGSSTDAASRDSLGSELSFSRQSSGSYRRRSDLSSVSRQSTCSLNGTSRRRGYMRPQGTDFAASAKSRESVMSLGSIAHLQYYFARTGLLDGKGAQLMRKKQQERAALDLSSLDTNLSNPKIVGSDADSSYFSTGSSPDFGAQGFGVGGIVESPIEEIDPDYYDDSFAESDPGMLPPTVSTYHHREQPVPKPPTILELKSELEHCLKDAAKALTEVGDRKAGTYQEPPDVPKYPNMPKENSQGWYELQGMHILDVVTLAIRAAKIYYTAHELPDRLDSIKPEKQVRADLLLVMEVLKQMATRNFKEGMKDDEIKTMKEWIESVFGILTQEQEIEDAESKERKGWTWLKGDWTGREMERERAFLMSMDPSAESVPEWTPVSEAADLPTPFLKSMQNGLRLVKLHNAAVKKSRRRFGAIPTFHTDTQKPYRCADNLRYWVKAAELRFEVMLTIDAIGVVYNTGPQVWIDLEAAILKWCRHVREEITKELDQ